MRLRQTNSGVTLIVSLVMLVVLTLLVVSAIRFGNINLKIAGNAQTEAEAFAATQLAIDTKLKEISGTVEIDDLEQQTTSISAGGASYSVTVAKPICIFTKNVKTTDLDPSVSKDKPCFEGTDVDVPLGPDGKPVSQPSACKDQQWDVAASVDDPDSGTRVGMLQGIAVRSGAEVQCP